MPDVHAKLGPSGAHRWLVCTASPNYELQFPKTTSVFAEEGTLAHKICELYVDCAFRTHDEAKRDATIEKFKANPLFSEEMLRTAAFYRDYLIEKANTFKSSPYAVAEVRVDLGEYVPEGFGTCDHVLIGDSHLHITDYKHGQGVEVSAYDNPQMKLYALGALTKYSMFYSIDTVSMAIVQPRITENVSEFVISADDLRAWGDSIRPIAQEAYNGPGKFVPGDHCRFCAGKAQCRARAESFTSAYDDFKGLVKADTATPEEKAQAAAEDRPILTDAEIGELVSRLKEMTTWFGDLQDYLMGRLLGGAAVPGWKIVEGRSARKITDPEKAKGILMLTFGVQESDILKAPELKSMTDLEKQFGKKALHAALDTFLVKPPGKPTLVPESDKRPPYSPAEADFKGIAGK